MNTTAGHSFYIGPIGSFYNQVNDTGSWEPLVGYCSHLNFWWEINLFFETFYYFFISWKADILPTTILLDPILDDYLKQLELMIFLFSTTNIH
jgi:hypothetical protein